MEHILCARHWAGCLAYGGAETHKSPPLTELAFYHYSETRSRNKYLKKLSSSTLDLDKPYPQSGYSGTYTIQLSPGHQMRQIMHGNWGAWMA